jgi:hypothetical protein
MFFPNFAQNVFSLLEPVLVQDTVEFSKRLEEVIRPRSYCSGRNPSEPWLQYQSRLKNKGLGLCLDFVKRETLRVVF